MCIKITEKIPFENQVYHYCSLETFRLIVENKVLFMSGYHYMNDSSEEKYFLDVFDEEMKNLYDGLSDEEKANIESDDYMKKYMTRLSELYANVCFICCFSNIRDDLNQWRAYGDDGKGICIGFDKSFFEGLVKEGFFAENVTYKAKEELHSFISEKLISIKNEHSLITDSVKFTREVKMQIWLKRAKVKNPAFLAENEFRIGLYDSLSDDAIKQYVFDDIHIGATGLKQYMGNIYYLENNIKISPVDYRTNKNRLIPYRKLELGSELFKAIKSVTIGPLCQASPAELAKFLVCKCDNCFCGIDTIYKSTLTYV